MASAHDRAVLQAIFNPTTPFGDIPVLNQEEELIDDGERGLLTWCASTYHVAAYWISFEHVPFLGSLKKWRCNQNLVLGDISVFSFATVPVSWQYECFFSLFISSCQTVALTRSCWNKWRSWRRGASRQQRPGICKPHFNCSARQSRSCLKGPLPTTTGLRPCGSWGTQQVHSTHLVIFLPRGSASCWLVRLLNLRPAWHNMVAVYLLHIIMVTSYDPCQLPIFLLFLMMSVTTDKALQEIKNG